MKIYKRSEKQNEQKTKQKGESEGKETRKQSGSTERSEWNMITRSGTANYLRGRVVRVVPQSKSTQRIAAMPEKEISITL